MFAGRLFLIVIIYVFGIYFLIDVTLITIKMFSIRDTQEKKEMKYKIKNIAIIIRHVKPGFRFVSGKRCYEVINISEKNVGLISRGLKTTIPSKLFYKVLNAENANTIHAWRAYEEIIGN